MSKKIVSKRDAAKALRSAALLIQNHGFCKNVYRNPVQGSYCALGALGVGRWTTETALQIKAIDALESVIGEHSIHDWNDAPGTTKKDVIHALRKTARALEHGLVVKNG